MTYRSELYQTRRWYIAHEILCAEPDNPEIVEPLTVWENLILIQANSPEEAYEKAMEHGRNSENEIRINGKEGRFTFCGLKELMLVYDDLEHGAELEWHEMELTKAQATELTKQKEQLHAFDPTDFED
jgi:ABC-type uncharacterized transport system ATPase subunit